MSGCRGYVKWVGQVGAEMEKRKNIARTQILDQKIAQ